MASIRASAGGTSVNRTYKLELRMDLGRELGIHEA